ncbi:hypothetical protein [Streptomyces chartreusis]|uniref:hypothetical protein n=1 Tax=Streptomyces chartreusis TaxID=1969 RepID=UPI0036A3D086
MTTPVHADSLTTAPEVSEMPDRRDPVQLVGARATRALATPMDKTDPACDGSLVDQALVAVTEPPKKFVDLRR